MALRDWKKDGKMGFMHKTHASKVRIEKLSREFLPNKYEVFLVGLKWNGLGYFKTKRAAIRAARAYMRKH